MFQLLNLGSFQVSGTGINKFNVSMQRPSAKGLHLADLLFWVNVQGTASGAITKKNFLNGVCSTFNLELNNIRIVDNMNGETLDRISEYFGIQKPSYTHPSVSGAGTYSVDYLINVPFALSNMISPYDFCPNVQDIRDISFEFQRGVIVNSSSESYNIRVLARIIQREKDYYVPILKVRKVSITKQISDTVYIANRTIAAILQFPLTGSTDDYVIMRTKDKTIADNIRLSDVTLYFNPPALYSDLQNSDLNYQYITLNPDRPASIMKPMFYENDFLFFDNLDTSNSPFSMITMELEPNPNIGTKSEIESRYSPSVKE